MSSQIDCFIAKGNRENVTEMWIRKPIYIARLTLELRKEGKNILACFKNVWTYDLMEYLMQYFLHNSFLWSFLLSCLEWIKEGLVIVSMLIRFVKQIASVWFVHNFFYVYKNTLIINVAWWSGDGLELWYCSQNTLSPLFIKTTWSSVSPLSSFPPHFFSSSVPP